MPSSLRPSASTRRVTVNRSGSTLLISLLTVTILSLIAGCILASITSRYNSAYRSGSWNDALVAAESGIDVTISQITGLLPDVQVSTTGLGTGYTQNAIPNLINGLSVLPTGPVITTPTGTGLNGLPLLSVAPPALTPGGEGGTIQQSTVTLQILSLSQILNGGLTGLVNGVGSLLTGGTLLNGSSPQLLCLYSTGTASLTGGTVADPTRQNNDLWRPSLITDRTTGKPVTTPNVSRTIQVILRPVLAFESAVVSNGSLSATDTGSVFDSFNSGLATASTNGLYDSTKRLSDGAVISNGPLMTLGGIVYGNVGTNGGSLVQDTHETGTVNNASYAATPQVKLPASLTSLLASLFSSTLSGSESHAAGTAALPAQYAYTGVTGNLHITYNPLAGTGQTAIVYVGGDFTGGIEVDPGVTAKVYVTGSIITNASKLKNDGSRAANLQIYGLSPLGGATPVIRLNSDANLIASIYAPGHAFSISGNNDVSGAIVAASYQSTGAVRVHYDEALAQNVGPILRFQIASWQEITN